MKQVLHDYDIFPKVFLVGEDALITVKPLGGHVAFGGEYTVAVLSMAHGRPEVYPQRGNIW